MKCIVVPLLSLLIGLQVTAQDYDLIVRGGRVVDGTGNPAFFADVAIKDGRIVAIGKLPGKATMEIDGKGRI